MASATKLEAIYLELQDGSVEQLKNPYWLEEPQCTVDTLPDLVGMPLILGWKPEWTSCAVVLPFAHAYLLMALLLLALCSSLPRMSSEGRWTLSAMASTFDICCMQHDIAHTKVREPTGAQQTGW